MLSRRRVLALAGTGLLAAGCGTTRAPALDRARENGTIRLGISGEEPFSYLDLSGQITGESPVVARAVLAGVGTTELEAVQRPFGQLIDALLGGMLDIVAAGMSITPGRCARVMFSAPDFVAATSLLVREGNPRRLHTFADIARAHVPVAVLDGSVEQEFARDAKIPEERIHAYGSQLDLFQAVFDGSVPVGALTDISLRRLVAQQHATGVEVTRGINPAINGRPRRTVGGFAFRPADANLCAAFNGGLAALQRSGEWTRIVAPFGVTAANLPPADLTTAELCQQG
ncbi:MAG TPA: ectoine/hydroxyectoine ABC transporter substrate-binding protein EhuB [Pseudonocardia sp.]|jgi:polar amino acid transport system substrate-binding protein